MDPTPTISNLVVLVTANTSQFNAAMGKASGLTAKFGAAAKVGMGLAAVGVAAAAAAAVDAASDQNEALNKSQVVFEDSAGAVERFANSSAESFGISKTAALEAASGFGAVLQTAGLTEQASAKMSLALTELGADMASFNNISVDDALLKLKSGLAGEAEPLRAVGVLLSEARVKQEAYASGIAKTGAELTEGQKVQARYNLILQDTAKQQGDFARTSEGLANQQRVLQAQFADLSAELGQKLLPAAIAVVDVLQELVTVIAGVDPTAVADETEKVTKAWMAGTLSAREYLLEIDRIQDDYNSTIELSDELFRRLQREADGIDLVSREWGSYFGPASKAADITGELGDAAEETADSLRDQRLAQLALVDTYFGVIDAMQGVRDAQKLVNRLQDRGRENTRRYDEAVMDLIIAQAAFRSSLIEVKGSTEDAETVIQELGRQVGLSKKEVDRLIAAFHEYNRTPLEDKSANIVFDIFRNFRTTGDSGHGVIVNDRSLPPPPPPGGPNERTRSNTERLVVTLDRRRFADTLDYDATYRGW